MTVNVTLNVDPLSAGVLVFVLTVFLKLHVDNQARFRALERKVSWIWYRLTNSLEPPDYEPGGGD